VAGDESSTEAISKWEREDRKAKSDIVLGIKSSKLKVIKGCNTSKEVWDKLRKTYQSSGPARKTMLLKRLTLHKMDESANARNQPIFRYG